MNIYKIEEYLNDDSKATTKTRICVSEQGFKSSLKAAKRSVNQYNANIAYLEDEDIPLPVPYTRMDYRVFETTALDWREWKE